MLASLSKAFAAGRGEVEAGGHVAEMIEIFGKAFSGTNSDQPEIATAGPGYYHLIKGCPGSGSPVHGKG